MTLDYLISIGADDMPALLDPARQPLSYRTLRAHVADNASALAHGGIGRADRVAIVLRNGPEAATAFLAVATAAVAAPLNPGYTAAEFLFYLSDLNARALIVEAGSTSPAIAVARELAIPILETEPLDPVGRFALRGTAGPSVAETVPQPSDLALLLHTSGTTGRPKLVPITHRQLHASARNIAATLQLGPHDRGLEMMPLFHVHGLVAGLLAPLVAGGSVHCTRGFDAAAFPGWIDTVGPTWLTAVPTMLQAILRWAEAAPDGAAHSGLRFIRSCSAALPPHVGERLEALFGIPVVEAYAMTEAAHQMTSNPLSDARRFGSVGRAAGPEVAILGATGRLLGSGEEGEIGVRGENVMQGYLDNPEANRTAFAGDWFRTGDIGRLDDDGFLWLTGRAKEMINRGGEKIAPVEIENVLLTHEAVAEAVAFAIPHATLGEDAVAAVVLRPGADADPSALLSFLLGRLSDHRMPREILLLDAIPKGPTGKLRRIEMAAQLGLDRPPARPAYAAPVTPSEHLLSALWIELLGVPDIGIDDNFFDLGGNSIAAVQIVARLRAETGVELPISRFLIDPTIRSLALTLTALQAEALSPEALDRILTELEGAAGLAQ
ncbi:non-ribosomal peptide synthetase [Sphingomonas sp. MMS24-J45]|uniref:non-ribosomal peptide synthetase n=1 Tax=Sphingomonas sp. MMS24-J45 TaxID=3238806 RepID=UPI00384B6E7E